MFEEDYAQPEPSPREKVAISVADLLEQEGLLESAPERSECRRYWRVGMRGPSALGHLSGSVCVYSDAYVIVFYEAATGDGEIVDGRKVFDSQIVAEQFLLLAFKSGEWGQADLLPERQPKRKKKSAAVEQPTGDELPEKFDKDLFGDGTQ